MNTYILILTMVFKSGSGGMGGIESIQATDLQSCKRMGEIWIHSVKAGSRSKVYDGELIYTCVKK